MSGFNLRRLTAGLVLVALLALAVPASAVPPSWSISSGFHSPGLLERVLGWIEGLFLGERIEGQAPMEKLSSTTDPNG